MKLSVTIHPDVVSWIEGFGIPRSRLIEIGLRRLMAARWRPSDIVIPSNLTTLKDVIRPLIREILVEAGVIEEEE